MSRAFRILPRVALAMIACAWTGAACSAPTGEPAATEPPAPQPPAPVPTPVASAAPPAPRPAPPPPAAPALPEKAEVEFAGDLTWPKTARGTPTLYVMDGTCFASTAFTIALVQVAPDGSFGSEIFVPQRTRLWLCGALLAKNGDITAVGEAPNMPFLAEGSGEVIIPHTTIALTRLPQPMEPPRPLDPVE